MNLPPIPASSPNSNPGNLQLFLDFLRLLEGTIDKLLRRFFSPTSNGQAALDHPTSAEGPLPSSNLPHDNSPKNHTDYLALVERTFYHQLLIEKIVAPMTQLAGLGGALQQEPNLSPSTRELIEGVVECARSASQLVDEYADVPRLLSGGFVAESQEAEPRTFLKRILVSYNRYNNSAYAIDKKVEFRLDIDKNLPRLMSFDERRINYVLRTFLDAATRSIKHSGYVSLSASCIPDKEIITFTIIDNGSGLSADDIQAITSKDDSFDFDISDITAAPGFGLRFARKVTEQIGGTIAISGNSTDGTAVSLYFPATPVKPLDDAELSGSETARVLFLDDSPDYRLIYERQLATTSMEPSFLYNGESALAAIAAGGIDIVLLNISLGDISAATFTRQARQLGATIPIIAVAPTVSQGLIKATKEAGCVACVSREKTGERLVPILQKYLTSDHKAKRHSANTTEDVTRTMDSADSEHDGSSFKNLKETLQSLQTLIDPITLLLIDEQWDTIHKILLELTPLVEQLSPSALDEPMRQLLMGVRDEDSFTVYHAAESFVHISQGISFGFESTHSHGLQKKQAPKVVAQGISKATVSALAELQKAIPTLKQLCSAERWDDACNMLASFEDTLHEGEVPTLCEHIMVLEALASAGGKTDILTGIQELSDHLDFYYAGDAG